MKSWKAIAAVAVLSVVALSSFAGYELYFSGTPVPCQTVKAGNVLKSSLSATTFGAVTEYNLTGPNRWPNAITTGPDGSVWFAEQELPGVAHLFPSNGTIVEYAWQGYPTPKSPDCIPTVNVSGIALWDGRVWAADEFGNRTIGLNPGDGSVISISSTLEAPFPYWLAVGPDGNLWFTSNNFAGEPSRLGRIFPNMTLEPVNLVGLGNDQPIQLDFVNSSLAFLATLNQGLNSTTHACICTGHIYSFNPAQAGSSVTPTKVGGDYRLVLPTSVSYSNGSVWVTQHGSSNIAMYDFRNHAWTRYPTSAVPWIDITLPLEIEASEGRIWFNEHYANRIAMLDPSAGTLTEYSESAHRLAENIQSDLSIAAAPGGVWFTSLSGNYIGFVNGDAKASFMVSVAGSNRLSAPQGVSFTLDLRVSGSWSQPLAVNVSDTENPQSFPSSIKIRPSVSTIQPGASPYDLGVWIDVSKTTSPGVYTIAVTVGNRLVQQTAYIFLTVGYLV